MLTVEDFKQFFTGEATLAECKSATEAQIGVSELGIDKGQYVSFYMIVGNNDEMAVGNMMGQFYADETLKKADVDASVAFLVDMLGDTSLLLFQVFNDDAEDPNLLFHPELSGKPHLKIYLIDKNERMYFYELELPAQFAEIHAEGKAGTAAYDKWHETFFENKDAEVEG